MSLKSQAMKDAKEFVMAKMAYGEGAGNRRKLIKALVDERCKNPLYKELFDAALANQDEAKAAMMAKVERKFKDGLQIVTKKIPKAVVTIGSVAAVYFTNKDKIDSLFKEVIK